MYRVQTGSGILASVAQYAISVYVVFDALTQIGAAVHLAAPTLLILPSGREVARDIVQKAYNRSNELYAF